MTIQDAIKSGKPFRRLGDFNRWYYLSPSGIILSETDSMFRGEDKVLRSYDILADDWEVKE